MSNRRGREIQANEIIQRKTRSLGLRVREKVAKDEGRCIRRPRVYGALF